MGPKVVSPGQPFAANTALKRFHIIVGDHVHFKGLRLGESLGADSALEGFRIVHEEMSLQVGLYGESLVTNVTCVRSETLMCGLLVNFEVVVLHKATSTFSTWEPSDVSMDEHVLPQLTRVLE